MAASKGKTVTIKNSVDMVPSLASTGEAAFEVGMFFGKGPRLPVFKLPALPANFGRKQKTVELAKTVQSSTGSQLPFPKYGKLQTFLEEASSISSSISYRNKLFLYEYLGVDDQTVNEIEKELFIRYYDSVRDPQKYKLETAFMLLHELRKDVIHRKIDMDLSLTGTKSPVRNLSSLNSTAGSSLGFGTASVTTTSFSGTMTNLRNDILAKAMETASKSRPSTTQARSTSHSPQHKSKSGSKYGTTKLAPTRSMENLLASKLSVEGKNDSASVLKVDLLRSLRSMQTHTTKIKEGIVNLQNMLDVNYPRAHELVISMACERLYQGLEMMVLRSLRRGFRSWKRTMQILKLERDMKKYVHLLGMRHVIAGLNNLAIKVLSKKYNIWRQYYVEEKERIRKARELEAIITIQRIIRGYIGRKRASANKESHKYQQMYESTIKLQSFFRMKLARWKYLETIKALKQDKAARLLQRVFRGYKARKIYWAMNQQKKRYWAAVKIQCAYRQRAAWKILQRLKQNKRQFLAAARIQALVRGFLVRIMAHNQSDALRRYHAAVRIQAVIRGKIVRKYLSRRRMEALELQGIRHQAAIKIQKTYRGYRAYVQTRILMLDTQRKNRIRADASTKICNMVRGFLARRKRAKLEKLRFQSWVVAAKLVQEMWSEESNCWFYYNSQTGEAAWEPPKEGYTKSDGKLVIFTGAIIDDPRQKRLNIYGEEEEDEDTTKSNQNICSECNTRFAIKACQECNDQFCTICYKATHSTGTRRNHHIKGTGLRDCSECEAQLAERWCMACDEGFCDGCWRKVHSRGNRRFHPFKEITPEGRIQTRIFTLDGSEVNNYDASTSLQQHQKAEATGAIPDVNYSAGDDGNSEWEQYYDDDGQVYYYNSVTGESQYENPGI